MMMSPHPFNLFEPTPKHSNPKTHSLNPKQYNNSLNPKQYNMIYTILCKYTLIYYQLYNDITCGACRGG